MRFAAIADIHGNCAALEAVLADIETLGISDIVNLGDCLSGPLEAGRTADLLMSRDFVTVRGNHDRYLIESPAEAMPSWEQHAFGELSEVHLDWLRGLPFSTVYKDEAYLCHATPTNDNLYWLEGVSPDGHVFLKPREEMEALASGIDLPLILCGHSHIPRSVRLSDGRLIINPGSVGCPAYEDELPYPHKVEAGHPMASYAILEKTATGWMPAFRSIRYDHMAMARLAAGNGRADWAVALATGWVG
jgi:predicted phosphodiesterase